MDQKRGKQLSARSREKGGQEPGGAARIRYTPRKLPTSVFSSTYIAAQRRRRRPRSRRALVLPRFRSDVKDSKARRANKAPKGAGIKLSIDSGHFLLQLPIPHPCVPTLYFSFPSGAAAVAWRRGYRRPRFSCRESARPSLFFTRLRVFVPSQDATFVLSPRKERLPAAETSALLGVCICVHRPVSPKRPRDCFARGYA